MWKWGNPHLLVSKLQTSNRHQYNRLSFEFYRYIHEKHSLKSYRRKRSHTALFLPPGKSS